ncbi:uncharacterized protein LOC127854664 [Dreissena polymorpha]|uniref:uncharacterized protein LOC127854664 n=1 Tax=Dreissena polymorpha TaxID=45954 RepID=UPI0022642819|nr:uncharacterized protein LOC127854664 [Dreissena polymorpha]
MCAQSSNRSSLLQAEILIVKEYQAEYFEDEIINLSQGLPISSRSSLLALNPYLDSQNVLRVGGRLQHSELSSTETNPVIVPKKSHLETLLIRNFHESVHHQGRHFTEGAIRFGGYWITGGKRRVSSYIFSCVPCRRLRGKQQNQMMADLPRDRVTYARPLSYVGVDVFGPWSIVSIKTRGGQASSKRLGVFFTCLSIRAIHIELIEEISSSEFINALRRFVSIRGQVVEIRYDRGTNFIGATENLNIRAVSVEDGPVRSYLQQQKVSWEFNPPHASHMGCVWEKMIGVVRRILDSLLMQHGQKNLTHDVLLTFTAEVSAIVNGRPLIPVSSDGEAPEDPQPSHLVDA